MSSAISIVLQLKNSRQVPALLLLSSREQRLLLEYCESFSSSQLPEFPKECLCHGCCFDPLVLLMYPQSSVPLLQSQGFSDLLLY